MSRVAYFDCASGASGDMVLGALVDMGLKIEALQEELRRLPLDGYRLTARKVDRSGLAATKVDVVVEARDHSHDGSHAAHGHSHAVPARGLTDILRLLDGSTLSAPVRERAEHLFRRLAEAEAAVHGTTPEEVHFHEVGAVDSIVDIVGGVIGLSWLGATRFVASPLNLGGGSVRMSHGVYPVPPPATARLVTGVPVYGDGDGELLTPTGALLVTGHATSYGPLPGLTPAAVGYGAGSRDVAGRPNVLRVVVGEEATVGVSADETVLVLQAEMDDMSPQLFGPLLGRLLAAGALDAYYTAIQMKKGRPGVLLTAVVPPARREALEDVLFAETTTLGVRYQEWQRTVLPREMVEVITAYGPVPVKVARRGGAIVNAQPEFDPCLRLATSLGVPVKEVWAAALSAFRNLPRQGS